MIEKTILYGLIRKFRKVINFTGNIPNHTKCIVCKQNTFINNISIELRIKETYRDIGYLSGERHIDYCLPVASEVTEQVIIKWMLLFFSIGLYSD